MPEASAPTLSIVVPAYRAGATLPQCLEALARVRGEFDLVVVDDGSGDGTADIAERHVAPIRERREVHVLRLEKNGGAGKARNAGAEKARGDWLLFADSDVALRPDAVEALRAGIAAHPDASAFVGLYTAEAADPGFFSRYQNYFTIHNHARTETVNFFWGALGAVRRDVFERLGRFPEHYAGASAEDVELGVHLVDAGETIRLLPALRGTHLVRYDLRAFTHNQFRKSALWAQWILAFNKRNRRPHGFTSGENFLSVAAAGAFWACAAIGLFSDVHMWLASALSAALFWGFQRDFLAFVRRHEPPAFTAKAALAALAAFGLVGVAGALGTLDFYLGGRLFGASLVQKRA